MSKLVLWIYDYFKKKPLIAWGVFLVMTTLLGVSVSRLSYKEDISDFLPMDEKNRTAMSIYQDISGANRIYAIVSERDSVNVDPDKLVAGVETFVENVEKFDTTGYVASIMKEVDMDRMHRIADQVYENIPFFLTDSDYVRIDSLLAQPDYIDRQMEEDKQMLMFPTSDIMASNIQHDPLNLFTPLFGRLKRAGMSINFDTYDGYILSPDGKKAIVIIESSFGARESEYNGQLVDMLEKCVENTELSDTDIEIHLIGGPVVAVANASRIKNDSILTISIAGTLILLLLVYVFRNLRNILLIITSVGWGWLFAMGGIALYYDSVSIIVIGIASVIIGIAVNYPLHLIDHLKNSTNRRGALREVVVPLVVGNVTTVGAFLCLVPLNAPALHDLGLFSSLLLVGTILFVLLFLPHIIRIRKVGARSEKDPRLITRLASVSLEKSRWTPWIIMILTVVFGYFSLRTEFDSDMRNINYMTPQQRADMAYFSSLVNERSDSENIYVVSSGESWEDALRRNELIDREIDSIVASEGANRQNNVSSFLISQERQQMALSKWNSFLSVYKDKLSNELSEAAQRHGFSDQAFLQFRKLLDSEYSVQDFDHFREFINSAFTGCISEDVTIGRKSIVQVLSVPVRSIDYVKEKLDNCNDDHGIVFDVKSMNGSIANTLSNDFNYIGFACGFIVFVFLWISFGRIELAIVSFLPMAFSWVWILGVMGILGIKFNIVNIILATFIFGQGDDYTIFITEGLTYEFAYRRKLLASYKGSIIVSALIMFIGIGTLLLAQHPAMRSLGAITVVGMISVVLMAYTLPPMVFNWLVRKSDGRLRVRPVTLGALLTFMLHKRQEGDTPENARDLLSVVHDRYIYKGYDVEKKAARSLKSVSKHIKEFEEIGAHKSLTVIDHAGQGEVALLLTLMYPDCSIYCYLGNPDSAALLKGAAHDLVRNLTVIYAEDEPTSGAEEQNIVYIHKNSESITNGIIETPEHLLLKIEL